MDVKSILAGAVAFLAAALLLSPFITPLYFGEALPLPDIVDMAAKGIAYGTAILHEAGHLSFAWSFGIPAVPNKDLGQGGAVIYFEQRAWLMQWLFWFFMIGFSLWLWFKKHKAASVGAMFFTLFHVIIGSQGGFEFVVSGMGFGVEMALGLILFWRGFTEQTEDSITDRGLSLFFAFYLIGRVMSIFTAFSLPGNVRIAYNALKDTHLLSDIEAMAFQMKLDLGHMAMFVTALLVSALVFVLVKIWQD